MLSNFLAQIWGIPMIAVSIALLLDEKHLKNVFLAIENDAYLLLGGVVNIIIGTAMVLTHNIWAYNWTVIVTVLGWCALLRGVAMLFLPGYTKKYVKKLEGNKWLPVALVVVTFIGLVLTYFGFKA